VVALVLDLPLRIDLVLDLPLRIDLALVLDLPLRIDLDLAPALPPRIDLAPALPQKPLIPMAAAPKNQGNLVDPVLEEEEKEGVQGRVQGLVLPLVVEGIDRDLGLLVPKVSLTKCTSEI
jgi:hypothetical protein